MNCWYRKQKSLMNPDSLWKNIQEEPIMKVKWFCWHPRNWFFFPRKFSMSAAKVRLHKRVILCDFAIRFRDTVERQRTYEVFKFMRRRLWTPHLSSLRHWETAINTPIYFLLMYKRLHESKGYVTQIKRYQKVLKTPWRVKEYLKISNQLSVLSLSV